MKTMTQGEKIVQAKVNDRQILKPKPEAGKLEDLNIFVKRVETKAYELYEKRGCQNGHDCDDWFEAEKLVEAEMIAGK